MEEFNPYAAPKAEVLEDDPAAAVARTALLPTESHLKAVGVLFVFGAALKLAAIGMMSRIMTLEFGVSTLSLTSLVPIVLAVMFGAGLCHLKPWAWRAACAGLGFMLLLGFARMPVGLVDVLIDAALLRFLLSARSRQVFGPAYQEVVRKTPFMRSRPASWVFVVMAVITVLLALAYVLIQL